ncbi:MAG: serine/threonine protein kinase [Synechococcaceae cyanobacterium RL_1_2]|nr:serine/threonine protein kinase [Synechococcaceae cyanobacterium RL_1_2]
MSRDFTKGKLLAQRYQLVEMVGKGAMGQVYRAEDTLLGGVIVAVKFLSQTLLNHKMRERFEREATICALLGEKSIHIVRVRDYGVDQEEIPFYVMEFLEGQSLSDVIEEKPLSLAKFDKFVRQICLGMEAAHQGILYKGELCPIIHRDIKPSNIIVVQNPTVGELVKVLDFGIAKLIQTDSSQTNTFMGTLAYCSPEQMEGKELDNRSDIYSLGVMMYEMLTTYMPIIPDNPNFGGWYQAHHHTPPLPFPNRDNIPTQLKDLIMECMAKDPNQRPQSVSEIISVLKSLDINSNSHGYDSLDTYTGKSSRDPHQHEDDSSLELFAPGALDSRFAKAVWPKNKPQARIVFPRLVGKSNQETWATLWVMLEQSDIRERVHDIRYNQFLFLGAPHPMILWITVLYNKHSGPRWLPCYLDLKTSVGQLVSKTLGLSGSYHIVFFAEGYPQQCEHVTSSTIAANQCKRLLDWIEASDLKPASNPKISKALLKKEFEKLKPVIAKKLNKLKH